MPNRLAQESSLYLQQHAENPVDWYPWCPEAFEAARAANKPVLISVGYSACHWCHVMAHESFEDEFIAQLMNEHFICIKIDREERPDLDHLYMEAVQMMNQGHGGWPLNVFCLPDGRPFAGGTYFPPDDRRGSEMVPWPQLLMRIADFYRRNQSDLEENAEAVVKNLTLGNSPFGLTGEALGPQELFQALDQVLEAHDDEYGGFGSAPKFPPSMTLDFLLAMRSTATVEVMNPDRARRIDSVINTTLTGMAHGGLFDQFGGGFARYSVDRHWLIPHFEKMLYDNGLLLEIYSRAFRRYPKPLYRAVVAETVAWLEREMAAAAGGYYSALDADSEGEEGKFYVWRPEEVIAVLGEERAKAVCDVYGITGEGNFEHGTSNPVLLAPSFETREDLADACRELREAREKRPRPGRDSKRLVSWNSLAARGLAEAAFTFGEKEWLQRARETVDWIWDSLVQEHPQDGLPVLASVAYDDGGHFNGYLDDYAFLAEATLSVAAVVDWLEPGASATYRERATALLNAVLSRFSDPQTVGFFFTSSDHESLVARKKEWFDNAIPAGNSSLVHSFRDLAQLTGDAQWAELVEKLKVAYPGIAGKAPQAIGHALSGFVQNAVGVAVIKIKDVDDLEPLRQALVARPWRRVFLEWTTDSTQPTGYQLCVGTQCQAPTTDPAKVAEQL
jgi:hypothetical protein